MNEDITATKQVETRDERGRFKSGHKPSIRFHTNPERRGNGRWKKEDSISYQYNMLMRMSPEEFAKYTPTTIAQRIALAHINTVLADDRNALANTIEITDRTEGKARQELEMKDSERSVLLITGFVIPTMPDELKLSIDRDIEEVVISI